MTTLPADPFSMLDDAAPYLPPLAARRRNGHRMHEQLQAETRSVSDADRGEGPVESSVPEGIAEELAYRAEAPAARLVSDTEQPEPLDPAPPLFDDTEPLPEAAPAPRARATSERQKAGSTAAMRTQLRIYLGLGWVPVALGAKSKAPIREKWPDLRPTLADVERESWANVRLNLGASGLIDVDLDAPEARQLAPRFLPTTPARWGRKSSPESHFLYITEPPTKRRLFFVDVDGDGKDRKPTMLLERRAGAGHQSMVPPSVHPETGERVQWSGGQVTPPATVAADALYDAVLDLATATLLARHWPAEGARHLAALSASGFLLARGLEPVRVQRIILEAAVVGGDTEDRSKDVASTIERHTSGEPITGGPTLETLVTDGARVVARLREWLPRVDASQPEPEAARPEPASNTEEAPGAAPRWRLWDAREAWDFPPPAWHVDELLPLFGVMWVAGVAHSGKSLLILYICLALAAEREEIARRFAIRQRPVILFVSREDGGGRLQARRADILAAWGMTEADLPAGRLHFLIREPVNLREPADVAELVTLCRAHGVTLLVLDTWTALAPGADPDSAKEQAALGAVVVALAEQIDGLVVVIDHARKNPPAGVSMADIYGPNQKAQKAEHALILRKLEEEDDRRIELLVDGKDTEGQLRFLLDRAPQGSREEKFAWAGTPQSGAERQKEKGNQNRERVFAAVPVAPAAATVEELALVVKLSESVIRRHLRVLAMGGRVQKDGKARATRYSKSARTEEPSAQSAQADSE